MDATTEAARDTARTLAPVGCRTGCRRVVRSFSSNSSWF